MQVLDAGPGCWILDAGFWTLDSGQWTLDVHYILDVDCLLTDSEQNQNPVFDYDWSNY